MKNKINQHQRSFFAWSILVDCAKKRQTITYGQLGQQLNIHHRAVRFTLGYIYSHCLDHKLPPLTVLIVNKQTRIPGSSFYTEYGIDTFEEAIENVYNYNWQLIVNPFEFAEDGTFENQLVKDLVDSPDNSEVVYVKVKSRGNDQILFREALLKVYNYSCAICGFSFVEALQVSHIIPYSLSDRTQKLDVRNGLLLCSTHHSLFDYGSLVINQDYTIEYYDIEEKLGTYSEYDRIMTINLHGKAIRLPKSKKHHPDKKYLDYHKNMYE